MRRLFCGIANCWRWLPIVWKDRDWDWWFLASIMEFKLRRMAEHERRYGHHVTSQTDAKRQLVCAILLKRLREDDYLKNALKFFKGGAAAEAAIRQQASDQRYLGLLLGKYLTHWWD